MICLEVNRGGKRTLAGLARGMWSLDVMVASPKEHPTMLYVGGSIEGAEGCVEWIREELSLGEQVSFRLLESSDPDPPQPSAPISPEFSEACDLMDAQLQFETLKNRLRDLKKRWGTQLVDSPDA